jgi:hypothetical protein
MWGDVSRWKKEWGEWRCTEWACPYIGLVLLIVWQWRFPCGGELKMAKWSRRWVLLSGGCEKDALVSTRKWLQCICCISCCRCCCVHHHEHCCIYYWAYCAPIVAPIVHLLLYLLCTWCCACCVPVVAPVVCPLLHPSCACHASVAASTVAPVVMCIMCPSSHLLSHPSSAT